jgi:hypothetical protein
MAPFGFETLSGCHAGVYPRCDSGVISKAEVFSLGLGGGRAISKRFSLQGGYIQYVAGRRTFNRGYTIGLTYLMGDDKSK